MSVSNQNLTLVKDKEGWYDIGIKDSEKVGRASPGEPESPSIPAASLLFLLFQCINYL